MYNPNSSIGPFRVPTAHQDNFNKAMATLGTSALQDAVADVVEKGAGKKRNMRKSGAGKTGPSDLYRIMKMCMERHYDPVIVFSFAKRECEQNALQMAKLDFTTADEKLLIEQVCSCVHSSSLYHFMQRTRSCCSLNR